MAGLKLISLQAGGWLLTLAGLAMIVDRALPARSNGPNPSANEMLPGLVLAATGRVLRQSALAKLGEVKIGSDED